jgi:hypothetical protein
MKKKPGATNARRAPPWSIAKTEAPLALFLHWGDVVIRRKEEVSQRTMLSCIATTFERLPPVVFSTTVVFALFSRQGRPDGETEILSFPNRIR